MAGYTKMVYTHTVAHPSINRAQRSSNYVDRDLHATTKPGHSWLSMVLRLRQHNIGYTADGFYRSDDPTNSVKALKEGG